MTTASEGNECLSRAMYTESVEQIVNRVKEIFSDVETVEDADVNAEKQRTERELDTGSLPNFG